MEYTIQKIARLANVSTRTLRHYDKIGLLKPVRINSNGYRIYDSSSVDGLQQILFFRELGMSLSAIAAVIHSDRFKRTDALQNHLQQLEAEQQRLDLLILTVKKTIAKEEGKTEMSDEEKFKGFKQSLLQENEQLYGSEIREKYGEAAASRSNQKFMNMIEETYQEMQQISAALHKKLETAVMQELSPTDPTGLEIIELHQKWLKFTWNEVSKDAYLGLVRMYLDDSRFTLYYDKNISGCAQYLHDAAEYWLNKP